MGVNAFILTVLKLSFLALLYFFIYRAIRTAVVDLRAPKAPKAPRVKGVKGSAAAKAPKAPRSGKGKPPVIATVRDAQGKKLQTVKLKTAPIQIGRNEACELRPEDTYLSQFHAKLSPRGGMWYVEDLGSTNGTYLNSQRLTGPVELHHGDQVKLGQTTLEFRR